MSERFSRLVLALTQSRTVERLFTRSAGRRVAERFVAGESIDDAIRVAKDLNRRGMTVSLDYLGEEVSDPTAVGAARRAYIECLEQIHAEGVDGNISVKLTQLGLAFDQSLAVDALREVAKRAEGAGATVTVDMEDSRYTQATLDVYTEVQSELGNLGIALQAYLHRTGEDLAGLATLGGHIRLCKGAYAEPPEVAVQGKAKVRAAYQELLARIMEQPDAYPAIATHDAELTELAELLSSERSRSFEYQMLYGVRTGLQDEIVSRGRPLRIYVPFGAEWYPYLTRRLAERPANLWFFTRAVLGR